MNFYASEFQSESLKYGVLILPFWQEAEKVKCGLSTNDFPLSNFSSLIEQDFKAKEGEILPLYGQQAFEQRIVLVGLGKKEKISLETLRFVYHELAKFCRGKSWLSLNLSLPQLESLKREEILEATMEGILLANYQLKSLKQKEDPVEFIKEIFLIEASQSEIAICENTKHLIEGVFLARDLVNGNADEVNPEFLKRSVEALSEEFPKIEATIFDKKRLIAEKFELLLVVSRGASVDPFLLVLNYQGNPRSEKKVVLVGKGVTYDTGGLNLKPTGSMETMKCDMAGAAACLGAIKAVAALGLNVNLSVVIPTTENSIDANSFKPGDVYSSYSGQTVEVTNTDAEGRLILADALAYATKNLNPTYLVDIATLTGAIDIALGPEASGLMSSSDELAQRLLEAGNQTGERLWRMPLFEEYKERLKSDFADFKSWNGRAGSSNVAAMFLKQFVANEIPWAHLDIASTAYLSEKRKYLPKYATGFGVRLLVDFVKKVAKNLDV